MEVFVGQTASAGFAIGPAFILNSKNLQPSTKNSESPEKEVRFFNDAVQRAAQDLQLMRESAIQQKKNESVEILEAHLMLLEDPEVEDQVLSRMQQGQNAEMAYHGVVEEFRQMFLQVKDELIRQRAIDLQDIRERVLFYMQKPEDKFPDLHLHMPSILIAHDLTPSQILSIDKSKLLGFITVEGSGTSHTAILARSLEVPAIVGASKDILNLKNGEEVGLNAEAGQLLLTFHQEHRENFLQQQKKFQDKLLQNAVFKGQASETIDGVQLMLSSNISGPKDLESFVNNDSEGVGLYRTEFLFLDREFAPSENEQYKIYKAVFEGVNGKTILVRTLDIGGDKKANYLNLKPEENPFLGVRALRLCFQRPDIFKTQLKALLRAGVGADWGLMFPMVSQLEELLLAKSFIADAQNELRNEGVAFSEKFQVGVMIEIPSAAWMMPVLAPHVDFISIGTNDLLQYTCAVDRLNPDLKSVYNPYNVGFLHQIHHVLKACLAHRVHAGICGSLSHHPDLMAFFIGCGVNELSMSSQHILSTRAIVRKLNFEKCQQLVSEVLSCSMTDEVKEKFRNFALSH